MKILIIDNFDSFTFNLYQCVGDVLLSRKLKFEIVIRRNNEITAQEITKQKFDLIIISPGPGNPSDDKYFGVCSQVLSKIGRTVPVLGICLGMQGMAQYYGGKVIRAKAPMHGKSSKINHDGRGIFHSIPQSFEVMRYHSLVADITSIPDCLVVTAISEDTNEVMGLRHREYPIEGIQFHPESIFTEYGTGLISNFLFKDNYEKH